MTTPFNTYTAKCWREGSAWVVHVPELDRTARAGRLSQVDGVAQDLVARVSGEHAGSARVVIDLRVPEGLVQLLAAAAAAREDRDWVSVEAVPCAGVWRGAWPRRDLPYGTWRPCWGSRSGAPSS